MVTCRNSLGRLRRGSSLLEMVLVLPVLLMISFGIVDYGYFFYVKSSVQSAAEAGARAAIVSGAIDTDVTSAVQSMMTSSGINTSSYTLTTNPTSIANVAAGTNVTVTVTCTWGTVGCHTLPAVFGGIPNSKKITSSMVMRHE